MQIFSCAQTQYNLSVQRPWCYLHNSVIGKSLLPIFCPCCISASLFFRICMHRLKILGTLKWMIVLCLTCHSHSIMILSFAILNQFFFSPILHAFLLTLSRLLSSHENIDNKSEHGTNGPSSISLFLSMNIWDLYYFFLLKSYNELCK